MNKLELKEDEITKIYEKSKYTWILCKFSDICDKYRIGLCLKSPTFPKTECKLKWQIRLYPNGTEGNPNNISLFVMQQYYNLSVSVKYLFRLQTIEDKVLIERDQESNFCGKESRGFENLITTDDLKSELKNDVLKIHVIIWTELLTLKPYHRINVVPEKKSLTKLKSDFQTMFENKEFADFVIKLKDSSEIPVHKTILAVRSPVFSAMLKNETFENKAGYLEISDIEKDTMMLLLNFMYTGSLCSDVQEEILMKLLPAADKYQLLDLKELCLENLANNLNVSNVAEILLQAQMYDAFELKTNAFSYIFENLKCFSDEILFQKLENTFPNLLTELLAYISNTLEPTNEE